ncbi:MAG: rhomboid family intramembrane serine protease [Bacteroidales bacterium]|nr:rhomboid family intramembrane serine protease [Bacteroidales bacterium]
MLRFNLPPVVRNILIINIIVFLADKVVTGMGYDYIQWLALFTPNTGYFRPFQLITHMFMHAGLMHIFFNMFGLVVFGKVIESVWGSRKMFILFFVSGLGAAGLQLLVYHLMDMTAVMVGASGALFGLLAAFALLFPNVELMLIFLPIPIKAKYMVPAFAILSLFAGVANIGGNIAHFAHLGGAIFGFFIALYWKKNQFRIY